MFENSKRFGRRVALMGLGLAGAGTAAAQQAPATIRLLPEDAERSHSGNQHNFYFLPPGVGGEQYQNAGFWGQKLRPYLAGNPESQMYLNRYRRQKSLFLADRLIAVGSLGVYGQQVFERGKFPQYFSDVQQVAGGVFVASLVATIFINHNTNKHLQRAVDSYNAGKAHGNWWHRWQPRTVGFSSSPAGQPLLALGWTLR